MVEQFTMSMYKSKEELYKAKAEYYENVVRKMTLIMVCFGPCKIGEDKVVFVDEGEKPTLEDLLSQMPNINIVHTSPNPHAFKDHSGSIVELDCDVDKKAIDYMMDCLLEDYYDTKNMEE